MMNTVTEPQADSVGAILRQSREAKGLTAQQVAKQLNLKVAVIEQIEAEQWDPAVSMTFMRGYLRAYARLMKLSEREILQAFELQAAYLRNQPRPMHSFSKKTSLDAAENRFMLATYLLIVLLIGLFLVWFWQTHLLDDAPVSVVPQYTTSTGQTQLDATPQQLQTHVPVEASSAVLQAENATSSVVVNQSTEQSAAQSAATTTQSGSAQVEPIQVEPNQTAAVQAEMTQAVTPMTETVAGTEVGTQQPANNANANPQTDASNTTPATTPSPSATEPNSTASSSIDTTSNSAKLQLSFSADCWLEVYDKNNQRLAFGNQTAGKQLELQGELPFNVKLGNPPAASMRLNDVVVDLTAYPAGRVARITLTGQL